jgi:competence protein ComEA
MTTHYLTRRFWLSYWHFLKSNWQWRVENGIHLGLGLVGLVSIGIGLSQLFSNQSQEVQCLPNQQALAQLPSLGEVFIDISGAVVNPGVYSLKLGQRWADGVERAGGFSDQADLEVVSQKLNLAQAVSDGDKIIIPFKPLFNDNLSKTTTSTPKEAASSAQSESVKISINSASLDELDSLPGIGPKRAADIVAARPFSQITDLYEKEIISESVFNEIKNSIDL